MPRIHQLTQQSDKHWTPWTTPRRSYRLTCCDCGLTHDIQFYVLLKNGKRLDGRKGQIKFRLRRNIRSTAACRRKKKPAVQFQARRGK